ncbi:MAG: phage portal protein [Thermoanaerobaculaceae bacterium]|jgi:HK97 family phage portal protein
MGLLARSLRVEKRTVLESLKGIAPSLWDQLHLTSAAGPIVTELTASKSTAVLACTRVISETTASLPRRVCQQLQPAGKRAAPTHPLFRIVHDKPNPMMTSFTFFETLQAHLCIWGNAYAEIVRNGNGEVAELWPIPPARVTSIWLDWNLHQMQYQIILPDGRPIVLTSDQILHVPGLSFDGFLGKSPVRLMAETIGLSLAAEEFTSRFFSNGAQLSGVVQHPGVMSDPAAQRFMKSIEEKHTGLPNAFRVMLLEEGAKWQETGMKLVEAQVLELRKFQVEDIARAYRVPLHLIQATDKSSNWGTGIEQLTIAFVTYCMRPWIVRWEQALQKLFPPQDTAQYFVEFQFDALMRGDYASLTKGLQLGRVNGWLNADEIREALGYNPIGGPAGQDYIIALNMGASGPVVEGTDTEPETDVPDSNPDTRAPGRIVMVNGVHVPSNRGTRAGDFGPLLDAAWERITRRASQEVGAAIEKAIKSGEDPAVRQTISGWLMEHREYVDQQLGPIVAAGWRPGSNGGGNGAHP